jgi:hypothetical protein
MKQYLIAATIITVLAAPATAEAKGCGSLCGRTKESYSCIPDNLTETLAEESDPVTYMSLVIDTYYENVFSVVHHTNKGNSYNRSAQYKFTAISNIGNGVFLWEGISRQDHKTSMRGIFVMSGSVQTHDLKYTYAEYIVGSNGRLNNGSSVTQSTCTMMHDGDGDPHDE